MKEYRVGYTQGVYDMFHIGHLNLLNRAKEMCDYLIVGVNSDELVQEYKQKKPVICQEERAEIIRNIKSVDEAIVTNTLDKISLLKKLNFNVVFIGDDWKGHPRWEQTKKELAIQGVDLVYLPYTEGVSSSSLRPEVQNVVND